MIRALDSKDRISLDQVVNKTDLYKITEYPDGTVILHPAVVMTVEELNRLRSQTPEVQD
ncbi:hypothetical protein P9209_00140 [Prescottella defluvii]|nr:hypothetical protein P9209_00140 [Prescottella defluvii]